MEFKDYYQTMGVEKSATPEEIKRAHRKLARKYHPDVSKEKNAEAQFKALAESYDVLKDPEKRAAYDQLGANYKAGQEFSAPPGWTGRSASGQQEFEQGQDHSDFFDALFRGMNGGSQGGMGSRGGDPRQRTHEAFDMHGQDQHAKIKISLADSYNGATRTLQLRLPADNDHGQAQARATTCTWIYPLLPGKPRWARKSKHPHPRAGSKSGFRQARQQDASCASKGVACLEHRVDVHPVTFTSFCKSPCLQQTPKQPNKLMQTGQKHSRHSTRAHR